MRCKALVLIVPFHNEERRLPCLIQSLRAQDEQVPIIFVDNHSSDGSASLVAVCDEVRSGRWTLLVERKVGKLRALRTGLAFCEEKFHPRHIGFVDADTTFADHKWIRRNLELIDSVGDDFGYTHSPIEYVGFDQMPVFQSAYLAYQRVIHQLQDRAGWFAHGEAFVCSAGTLARYFQGADITTEFDLRCSLLALSEGRRACWNPSTLFTSGRRIIVNAKNFRGWCFYDRDFYVKKDINAANKLNLDRPEEVGDLDPSLISCLFERRALKVATRNLMPLAIFDTSARLRSRLGDLLGIDVLEGACEVSARFGSSLEWLFTDRFDEMARVLEELPATAHLVNRLVALMSELHQEMLLSAVESHVS